MQSRSKPSLPSFVSAVILALCACSPTLSVAVDLPRPSNYPGVLVFSCDGRGDDSNVSPAALPYEYTGSATYMQGGVSKAHSDSPGPSLRLPAASGGQQLCFEFPTSVQLTAVDGDTVYVSLRFAPDWWPGVRAAHAAGKRIVVSLVILADHSPHTPLLFASTRLSYCGTDVLSSPRSSPPQWGCTPKTELPLLPAPLAGTTHVPGTAQDIASARLRSSDRPSRHADACWEEFELDLLVSGGVYPVLPGVERVIKLDGHDYGVLVLRNGFTVDRLVPGDLCPGEQYSHILATVTYRMQNVNK